ncbi:hypothetical protein Bca4012_085815 [Brassica carinata]
MSCADVGIQLFDWGMMRLPRPFNGVGDPFAMEPDDHFRKKRDAQVILLSYCTEVAIADVFQTLGSEVESVTGKRKRKENVYSDSSSEVQWMKAVESEERVEKASNTKTSMSKEAVEPIQVVSDETSEEEEEGEDKGAQEMSREQRVEKFEEDGDEENDEVGSIQVE